MPTERQPDPLRVLAEHQPGTQRFTVHQDGRSGDMTVTTQDGETFIGADAPNDVIFRFTTGAEPRSRMDTEGQDERL